MIREDKVFVVNVMVTNLTRNMLATCVINWLANVVVKINAIVKIHKYRRVHEGHHFISMSMEAHDAFKHDMDHFIKECAHIFHDRRSKGHLSLSFCIHFSKLCVNIALQHALTSTIKRNIVLTWDLCSRPPNTIILHDLHAGDIKRALGEITSYHEKD